MNFIKRALLSVKARKGKSLLQVFVFTVICVLVLAGLSIQSAAEKSSELARQKLGGQVTLSIDMEKAREQQQSEGMRVRFQSQPISVENAEELVDYEEVKAYNFYTTTMGAANDFEPIENEATSTDSATSSSNGAQPPSEDGGRMPGGGMMDADVNIEGVVFTDSVQEFMDSEATIVEGRHLTEDDLDKNVTIIEKTLANENDLQIGEKMTVSAAGDSETSVELELVGIYETTSTSDNQGMNLAFMNPYNKMYVPYTAANALKGTNYEGTIDNAVFYMSDPSKIQHFIDEATANSSIDFGTFKLDANDQLYQQMVGPIENIASFSSNIVYLVTIAGAVILGLIVMMSIRERKYEMGVLLAIGEKRWKLIGQFITEILVIAVLALGISTISGNIVANQISDKLLTQELQQSEEATAMNPASFGERGGFRGSMGGPPSQQQVDTVEELQIDVSSKDLGTLSIIGLLIAIISTLLPSLSVLRLQPKTILTKQD
jgi:putative ABC transport system permease protein